jgi:hypothetical protein
MSIKKPCKFDMLDTCHTTTEETIDLKNCCLCIMQSMIRDLYRKHYAVVGYDLHILTEVLKELGYLPPKPLERGKEENLLAR